MAFFPRFPAGEFAPLFRLLDDYASHVTAQPGQGLGAFSNIKSFQPRFDVREVKDAYELHGELPGIDQKDIKIEFTDAQTLSISGRTERHSERGTRPSAIESSEKPAGLITEEAHDSEKHEYHKATVEDEAAASEQKPSESTNGDATAVTAPNSSSAPTEQKDGPKYWVSERSVGEFHRSFNFPTRVDQDAVKASLKNGVLSIHVPKATAPQSRTITIE